MIIILVKSNLGERCLVNELINMSSEALEKYLDMANIYSGKSTKKKNTTSRKGYLWVHYKYNK